MVVGACGGGEAQVADTIDEAFEQAAQEAIESAEDTPTDEENEPSSDSGSGIATATLNGASYELVVSDPCLISDLGIAATAVGDGAELEFGGLDGAATLSFTVDGIQWIAAGAPVMIDGETFVYDATVTSSAGTGDLTFTVACNEFVAVPG